MRRADVVLYDSLTNPSLLKLAKLEAEKIFVGKKAGGPRPDQEWINNLMIAEARKGKIVARLKGGDSFVFGRGGEEVEALLAAGIRFEVVPGVTSAVAAPASAGIPVTRRGINSILHVIAGYEDPDDPKCSIPWDLLARPGGTIVILMGASRIDKILMRLRVAGLSDSTPLATIQRGTWACQKSLRSTLGKAAEDPASAYLPPPSITVIGEAAGLDEGLNWFERRPLFGRSIILTRDEEKDWEIADSLSEAGAEVVSVPLLKFEATGISAELVEKLNRLRQSGGWLILPSPTAIRFFFEALKESGLDARALGGIRVAVIGERSARDLLPCGIRADFVPDEANAASLAETLPLSSADRMALIAGSSISRPELAEGLRKRGVSVEHHSLYVTLPNAAGIQELNVTLAHGSRNSIVLFSPSAAEAIAKNCGKGNAPMADAARWVAIGPTTAQAMRELGFKVHAICESPDAESLVEALAKNVSEQE